MKKLWGNRFKKLTVFLTLTALLAATAACGGQQVNENQSENQAAQEGQDAGQQDQNKREPVNIGYLNVMDDAQAILAHEAGLYKKHGIEENMQLFSSGTDLIKAIVGGQLDAGVLGFTNALTWIDKGADIKIVGGAQMGFHSMLVHEDSGIERLQDLKGKTVASQQQGSTADIVLNGVVWKKAGIEPKDVQMQYVSPAVAIQSLAAGKVDGAFVFEPYDSIAQLTMPVKQIYEIGQDWPFPCMVVITSGKMLKERKDTVYALLDAQKEAIEMLQNDPAKSAELIRKHFIAEDTLQTSDGETVEAAKVIEQSITSQTFNWEITPEQIETMQEIAGMLVEQGILEKELDVKQALDLSWQEQLAQ
jgi:NitT/TauT family transport system substrate-binding protein